MSESTLKSYQKLTEDAEIVSIFKYLPGQPKQYRFNGQTGQFNQNGDRVLNDEKGKALKSFTITPMAWRVFEENLFGRGRKDLWGEFFFVDGKNCVSSIMLNNTSLQELLDLASELFYEDMTLAQIRLTMTAENLTGEKNGQKTSWYITRLTWEMAPKEEVQRLADFAADYPIYRADTLTQTAVYRFKSESFYLPEFEQVPALESENATALLPE